MREFPFAWMAVGGGAAALAHAIARAAADAPRLLVVDTDVLALQACEDAEVLLIGETRFEGAGTGGHPVNGRLAVLDDEAKLRRALLDVRLLVVLTALGGGTGSGATPEILKQAREMGIRTLCFALLPFSFAPGATRAQAERAIPQLEEAADALVMVSADALCAPDCDAPLAQALEGAATRLGEGLLLLHRLLSLPGPIRLGVGALCRALAEGGGCCRFAVAEASGADRARQAVAGVIASPLLGSPDTLASAKGLLLGILGGDDLRLQEVEQVMSALRAAGCADGPFSMGTVLDPALKGRLALVVLVFERWESTRLNEENRQAVAAPFGLTDLSSGRRRKRGGESRLSFGPTGRGRFKDVDPTLYDGKDLDIPTYQRRGIVLET